MYVLFIRDKLLIARLGIKHILLKLPISSGGFC